MKDFRLRRIENLSASNARLAAVLCCFVGVAFGAFICKLFQVSVAGGALCGLSVSVSICMTIGVLSWLRG